jgi:hypothetical protein
MTATVAATRDQHRQSATTFPVTTTQLACIDYLHEARDTKSLLRRRDMCQPSSNLQSIDEAGGRRTPNPPSSGGDNPRVESLSPPCKQTMAAPAAQLVVVVKGSSAARV